jgi:hypothetical protein
VASVGPGVGCAASVGRVAWVGEYPVPTARGGHWAVFDVGRVRYVAIVGCVGHVPVVGRCSTLGVWCHASSRARGARGGRWVVFDVGGVLGGRVSGVGVVSLGRLKKRIKLTFFPRRLEETRAGGTYQVVSLRVGVGRIKHTFCPHRPEETWAVVGSCLTLGASGVGVVSLGRLKKRIKFTFFPRHLEETRAGGGTYQGVSLRVGVGRIKHTFCPRRPEETRADGGGTK